MPACKEGTEERDRGGDRKKEPLQVGRGAGASWRKATKSPGCCQVSSKG